MHNTTQHNLDIVPCSTYEQIQTGIAKTLAGYTDILPTDRNAAILIKPNLNSNMNALTGNTTDLRLLSALIIFLKNYGYTDITIGEGTNSGFYRSNISVISRLKVDELARYFGVNCIDLNQSQTVDILFENRVKAGVAKECMEADFLINMPKLKTHFEAGMSVCLKNLIGCLKGQDNKKKTHLSLARNIVHLTQAIKPDLHIVDAVIAMEGLGPTRGTPVKADKLFIGTDPYLIDLLAARYAGVDPSSITPLAAAREQGLITQKHDHIIQNVSMDEHPSRFAPPKAGPIAEFIHNPVRQKYFLAVRNTPVFNYLCNTDAVGKLLFISGLRQDVFIDDEMEVQELFLDESECTDCGKCNTYCPIGLELPDSLKNQHTDACISCLYCFCICPEHAVKLKGTLGFMEEQLRQYDGIIRTIA